MNVTKMNVVQECRGHRAASTSATRSSSFSRGWSSSESKIRLESLMATFYFFHATAALLRLIFQTSAHPRTAILVNTMIQAAGDLWHFLILFVVLNFGFIALGMAQFASDKVEFSSPMRSFETLWEMLLGSMIESGDIPSSTWSFDPLVMIYLISCMPVCVCAHTHTHTIHTH